MPSSREGALQQLAERFRGPRGQRSLPLRRNRVLRQVAFSVLLLLLVGLLRWISISPLEPVQALVISALTEEIDWTGLVSTVQTRAEDLSFLPEVSLPVWLEARKPSGGATFSRPVEGAVVSGFGWRDDPATGQQRFHSGVDFGADVDTPVRAARNGQVIRVWDDEEYGLALEIEHDSRYSTLYAHLNEVLVDVGEQVPHGDVVALSGESGRVTGAHLHFEIRIDGSAVDPLPLLGEGDK